MKRFPTPTEAASLFEETTRTVDAEVIALAAREGRILLTEGKDFGWFAFVARADSAGVILIRFPGSARQALGPSIVDLVAARGDALRDGFTVLQPGQARITPRLRGPARG